MHKARIRDVASAIHQQVFRELDAEPGVPGSVAGEIAALCEQVVAGSLYRHIDEEDAALAEFERVFGVLNIRI